jgi:DNA-binding CsgD family transcriptional regulator
VSASLVGLVDAAYRVEASEQQWLEGMVAAVRPLSSDAGAFATLLDAHDIASPRILGAAMSGIPLDALARAVSLADDSRGLAFFRSVRDGPAVRSVRAAFGEGYAASRLSREILSPLGLADVILVNAGEVDGIACTLGIPVSGRPSSATFRLADLVYVQAHIAAAHRMRRYMERSAAGATGENDVDAVLDLTGHLHHVTRSADRPAQRAALRAAALSIDRARALARGRYGHEARGPQPAEPADATGVRRTLEGEALAMWQAMVMGEWTLVDHFERDGRRFLVARRNRPQPADHPLLSRREREVVSLAALGYPNKLASYALGLSSSTIASLLRRASRKLGARTRAELIRAWLERSGA